MELTLMNAILAVLAVCGMVGAVLLFRAYPRIVIVVWAATLFLVPIWVGVQAGIYFSALVLVTVLAIASASLHGLRWTVVDTLVVTFVLLLLMATAIGGSTGGHLLIVLIDWMIPYAWGRVVLSRVDIHWVHGVLAGGAVLISVLALAEFVVGTNVFVAIDTANPQYLTWGELQPRGGVMRVEASFGHSIALGSSLAIASGFVAVARWPMWLRLLSLVVVLAAAGVTFSRIGIVGVFLTLLLAAAFLGAWMPRAFRIALVVLLAAIAAIGLPFIWNVFEQAGEEAAGSAEYRGNLVALLGDSSVLGITPSWTVLPTGETYYGSFQSIDNALILTALRFGLLPLGVLIAIVVVGLVTILRGRGTPASIALVAQTPALVSVALITQYADFLWFTVGLAVASYTLISKKEPIEPHGGYLDQPALELGGAGRDR
ncbi:hypothetical protein [Mycetocola sp. 2940]|uniref:hypothetical protein n=1 Tax=Mycetocola sp. 2940 TaxID=3156452 RepID=UPI0033929FDF